MQSNLDQLLDMVDFLNLAEGRTETVVPFFSLVRRNRPTTMMPGVLTPSFCMILQGSKKLHLGQDTINYGGGDYLVSLFDIPASGQVVGATRQSPYIGLCIDLTPKEIAFVMTEAEINVKPPNRKMGPGAYVGKSDEHLLLLFIRLLELRGKPEAEIRFLSSLIKREMIFRLLTGDYGHLFVQRVFMDQQNEGISRAIEWIKENYNRTFTIEEVARSSNMSVSGLHHKFKAVTTMAPLQYQKQLRLQEARRLMLNGSANATAAALEVGYESPAQFSREYRRHFGLPPLQDIKALHRLPVPEAFETS
ncbi:AraC family transcriptional regulator N-terminal domain-containing protein [Paenibacillus allorhizosphaerae]|uniref:HTH-type transcriptional activator RhaS n=1 Tax=Paenibacillus allorhizosphaerae TaxID=2849866 RepID=A0ABN7TWR1_9BACL|nr:AraC family transcriptional regulator [Paenibacillus allorhizosphaerae]CAG7658789.1 HTH-type transcriptional activator RhaS [Paenibacillus allorhizosphaerae]